MYILSCHKAEVDTFFVHGLGEGFRPCIKASVFKKNWDYDQAIYGINEIDWWCDVCVG